MGCKEGNYFDRIYSEIQLPPIIQELFLVGGLVILIQEGIHLINVKPRL